MGLLGFQFRCRLGRLVHIDRLDPELDRHHAGADTGKAEFLGGNEGVGNEGGGRAGDPIDDEIMFMI